MLNFNHLYYFHVAAMQGSVASAAEQIGVAPSTVSEQIRSLERALRVQLFERIAGGLRLTEAGRTALDHTSQMFAASQRLVDALGKATEDRIVLRVGISAALSRTMTADFLMPVLTIDKCTPGIRSGEFSLLLRDLRAHELDLVLGETISPDQGGALETTLISTPRLIAIASPDLEPAEDWRNLALLEYSPASAFHWEVDAFMRERDLRPSIAGTLDDALLMVAAVSHGGFVAFVPRTVAREALNAGKVKQLASFHARHANVHAIFHTGATGRVTRDAVERLIQAGRENAALED